MKLTNHVVLCNPEVSCTAGNQLAETKTAGFISITLLMYISTVGNKLQMYVILPNKDDEGRSCWLAVFYS